MCHEKCQKVSLKDTLLCSVPKLVDLTGLPEQFVLKFDGGQGVFQWLNLHSWSLIQNLYNKY